MKSPPNVQDVAEMRARYPAALEDVFDQESIALGVQCQPGEIPACTFDFGDGLRLIVSRDSMIGMGTWLHVSASFAPHSLVSEILRARIIDCGTESALTLFRELCELAFVLISCDHRPIEFLGLSPASGIPHWIRRPAGGDR